MLSVGQLYLSRYLKNDINESNKSVFEKDRFYFYMPKSQNGIQGKKLKRFGDFCSWLNVQIGQCLWNLGPCLIFYSVQSVTVIYQKVDRGFKMTSYDAPRLARPTCAEFRNLPNKNLTRFRSECAPTTAFVVGIHNSGCWASITFLWVPFTKCVLAHDFCRCIFLTFYIKFGFVGSLSCKIHLLTLSLEHDP